MLEVGFFITVARLYKSYIQVRALKLSVIRTSDVWIKNASQYVPSVLFEHWLSEHAFCSAIWLAPYATTICLPLFCVSRFIWATIIVDIIIIIFYQYICCAYYEQYKSSIVIIFKPDRIGHIDLRQIYIKK